MKLRKTRSLQLKTSKHRDRQESIAGAIKLLSLDIQKAVKETDHFHEGHEVALFIFA